MSLATHNNMLNTALTSIALISTLGLNNPIISAEPKEIILAKRELSLENRHPVPSVNEVFKDNILLTAYNMRNGLKPRPDFNEVRKPFVYEYKLETGEAFAYHDHIDPKYKVVKTTNSHFNGSEGFKHSGNLMGDGVCHFASLIYYAAKDANLEAVAPVNHDFAAIPDIPREYGVAIYNEPSNPKIGEKQNLYIVNNKGKPVYFRYEYKDNQLKVSIIEKN